MNSQQFSKLIPTTRSRSNRMRSALILGLLLVGLFTSVAVAQQPEPTDVPLPDQLPVAASGGVIFAESCAPCHGEAGEGDGPTAAQLPAPPPSFTDPQTVWEQSPADYFHITKYGRIDNLMPPWQNQLTDEQIWQAVYYAWSLHTDAETVASGQALYEAALANAESGSLAALDALTAPDALPFATNAALADALQSAFPDESAGWTDAERQSVLDAIRVGSYIPPWESAYRAGDGVISGQVALVTAGEDSTREPLADHPVTLYAYNGFELAQTVEGQTDAEGRFRFEELSTNTGVIYIAESQYGGVTFSSDLVELSTDSPSAEIDVPVYEATDDDSGIYISRGNWIIDAQPGSVVVGLVLTFGNRSSEAFVGRVLDNTVDTPLTVGIPLPQGAIDVQMQDGVLGGRYQQVGNRIYDTLAVPPGDATSRMFLSYRLPVDNDGALEIAQEFLYPADRLNLLIAEIPGLEAEASTLEFVGNDTAQGFAYRLWAGENVGAQIFSVDMTGLIPPDGIDPRSLLEAEEGAAAGESTVTANIPTLEPVVPMAVGGVLLVALAAALVWPLRRTGPADPAGALAAERERLIRRIARLDDQRALDQIPEGAWREQRTRLKQRLLEVAAQLSDEEPSGSPDGEAATDPSVEPDGESHHG